MAVVVSASGEEALDDAFEAGHPFGQRLNVFAKGSHVATNFRAEVLPCRVPRRRARHAKM